MTLHRTLLKTPMKTQVLKVQEYHHELSVNQTFVTQRQRNMMAEEDFDSNNASKKVNNSFKTPVESSKDSHSETYSI